MDLPRDWTDYLLNEAFYLLGYQLYGSDWRGDELSASPYPSPEEMAKQRMPFIHLRDNLDQQIDELDALIGRIQTKAEMDALVSKKGELQDQLAKANSELWNYPEPTSSHRRSFEGYQRSKDVEHRLIEALITGEIPYYCLGSYPSGVDVWRQSRGYKYYIGLSMVCFPRHRSGNRRASVRIPKVDFDLWVQTIEPMDLEKALHLPLEEKAAIWFAGEIKGKDKEHPKEHYINMILTKYPGLSREKALGTWTAKTPDSWQYAGRPKKKS